MIEAWKKVRSCILARNLLPQKSFFPKLMIVHAGAAWK